VNAPTRRRGSRRLRITGLILIVLLLAWLPVEDTHSGWAIAYGAALCAWGVWRGLDTWRARANPGWKGYMLLGGLGGLGVTPATLLVMVFKNGLHSHEAPDFPLEQMIWVAQFTPGWVLAGLLLGLGAGLWHSARSR
jgi:hypothetical protein